MTPVPPSGRQLELVSGDARAVVTEVGAGLRRYAAGGADVVAGFPVDAMASGGRGQQLLPWPNRVGDGRWEHGGRTLQLPLTQPASRTANHGLARWLSWEVVEAAPATAVLRTAVVPQPGWPFRLSVTTAWRLTSDGLHAEVTATCRGAEAAPWGYGAHPYLAVAGGRVEDAHLHVPAGERLVVDERGLPVGREPVAGTAYDFRAPRAVGDAVLDTCFGDLRATEVAVRSGDRTTTVWGDGGFRWFQVFTGDTLAEAERRRSLAVEPMTCPPDALRSGEDLVWLEPGESWTGIWGIRPS